MCFQLCALPLDSSQPACHSGPVKINMSAFRLGFVCEMTVACCQCLLISYSLRFILIVNAFVHHQYHWFYVRVSLLSTPWTVDGSSQNLGVCGTKVLWPDALPEAFQVPV